MKTSILEKVCIAFVIILMNGFVSKAQEQPFYDTVWEEGRVVSRTKHEMGRYGMCVRTQVSKYTYGEEGGFLKKEVLVWNKKYKWNEKAGKYCPDYDETNWTPSYCILYTKDSLSDFVALELCLWNRKQNGYDSPIESMHYQLNVPQNFNYLAFYKDNKYDEWVNNISYDRELLAKSAK